MTVNLCVLLWATPGCETELIAYEDTVLALIPLHDGRVTSRVRRADDNEGPLEVQIIHFADEDAVSSYMNDPARQALADVHHRVIARTDVIPIEVVV
jgi:uncharacterized protein (DUF1330 family)